jgi:hypothetical protein
MKSRFSLTYLLVATAVIAVCLFFVSLPTSEEGYALAIYGGAALLYLMFAPGDWSASRWLNVFSAGVFLMTAVMLMAALVAIRLAWKP